MYTRSRFWYVGLLLLICCGLIACAEVISVLEEEKLARESPAVSPRKINPVYEQVLEQLEHLTPSNATEIRMGTEKDRYRVEEPLEVRFAASQDSYMVLMRIATDGTITFLAPSRQVPDPKIQGGRVYSTGSSVEAQSEEAASYDLGLRLITAPPAGTETLNLFCSAEKFELFDVDFAQEPFYTITPEDDARLRAFSNRLKQLQQIAWSGTSVMIKVGSEPVAPPKMEKGISASPDAFSAPQAQKSSGQRRFGALPPMGATGTTGKFFPPIGVTGTTGKTDTSDMP